MNKEKAKNLIGKTLLKIDVVDGDLNICCKDIIVRFIPVGDCCSTSWIEHFESPTEPCEIVDFKEIDIPPTFVEPEKSKNEYDVTKYYFYEMKTTKGDYLIEMRNSSNGYYGGSLE